MTTVMTQENPFKQVIELGDQVKTWFQKITEPIKKWWTSLKEDDQVKSVAYIGCGILIGGGILTGSKIVIAGLISGAFAFAGCWLIYKRANKHFPGMKTWIQNHRAILEVVSMTSGFLIGISGGIVTAITFHMCMSSWLSTFQVQETK